MKAFGCKDVGDSCEWSTTAETEDEILREAEAHARSHHGYTTFTDDMKAEIRSKIRDVAPARPEATLDRISLVDEPRGEGAGQINRRSA